MRNKIHIIAGIIIMLSLAMLVMLPRESTEYNAYVTITKNIIGFNVDTDALWFGKLTPGQTSTRRVNITADRNSRVVLKSSGNISDWLLVSKNKFKLGAGDKQEVKITLVAPRNAQPGDYEGVVGFYFYRDFTPRK